ncbi:MAG: hypothetical protein P8N51_05195, partial [Pseudomonadales bacterium]|nr:hypothetical protein [Pseudomonadales bacterium]
MTDYQPLPKEFVSPKPATEATKKINQQFIDKLNFADRRSFENAQKGFIATLNPITIPHDSGSRAAFDLE